MKIKRYVVRNMHEAFTIIRQDLGSEAVIINSKKVREGGLWGLFSPKKLEVTAAVDDRPREEEIKAAPSQERLEREMAEMKQLLNKLAQQGNAEHESAGHWRELLHSLEIDGEVCEQLMEGLEAYGDDSQQAVRVLINRMAHMFEHRPPQPGGRVITFVGPTGVGKTTTMAKLAAQFALYQGKKVAMVTIDTYRIGAVEQLKTYGEIIGIPIDVVMTPSELKSTVERHQDKDVILVDTAGRPSKNTMQIMELRGFLEQLQPVETALVLSCTTRSKDLMRIAQDFKQTNYSSLIFTKADETETLGPIVNIVYQTGVPVRYITNGQNVPDDIEEATPHGLAKMILGAVSNA